VARDIGRIARAASKSAMVACWNGFCHAATSVELPPPVFQPQ
jgi:hypothetical protein